MTEADVGTNRVLIVEDDAAIRGLLREYLCDDYACAEAGSAEEALALLRDESFDLVLSDIQMPGVSGLEMVPRLLGLSPDVIVIMVSGISTIESAIEAMRAGAFDYVTKPLKLDQIGAAVRRALDHRALREAHRQSEARLRQLVEHAADIIYRTDAEGRFTLVNPVAARLMRRPAEELIGTHYLELVRPDHRDAAAKFYGSQFVRKKSDTYYEFPAVTGDGEEVWLGQNVQLLTQGERVIGFQAVARDITQRRYHDSATGLPNRALFEDRLSRSLASAPQAVGAVLMISPDRLNRIVETLGQAAGDRLLRGFADRLARCVGEGDLLARTGDGEFSVVLSPKSDEGEVAEIVGRLRDAMKLPFHLEARELYVTASIGIAAPPRDGEDAQALMKNALAALFRARERGGDGYQFYSPELNDRALGRLSLESDLRRALEREELVVYYHPQVDIGTRGVVGAEALVRWQHPERGMISPAEFIPMAEESGLIEAVDEWVLRATCAQNRAWQDVGLPRLRVSSNLSARLFRRPDLAEMIAGVLWETGLDPDLLDLELTESSVMSDAETAIATLRGLRELGAHVSIDDFGTGYSSLNYLKKLPVDYLKIDQSFVRDATAEPKDAAIVMAIITLAHSLELKVIAEGVETAEQFRFLRLLRCDEMQGFLFSKPLPADDFARLLLEGERLLW